MANKTFTISPTNLDFPTGKNIIITGGSSGFGLSTSLLLASHNNHVVSLDRNPPTAQSTSPSSSRISHISCDIVSYSSQRSAFSTALSSHFPKRQGAASGETPKLDAVFINAGINEQGNPLLNDSLEEPDRRTLDIDLRHLLDTLKLALYYLRNDRRKQRGGSIVMTASLAGYLGSAGAPLYSAAKHGVVGLLRSLKADCAGLGVAISVVAPGISLTNIVAGRPEGESIEAWGARMSALGVAINSAEEVARVVVWLIGKGKAANGVGLMVQGGRCADMERGIATTREAWMGREMLDLFRGGRKAPLFPKL